MQLAVKYGVAAFGATHDFVIGAHPDSEDVPMDKYPGCRLIPYAGDLGNLDRAGPIPDSLSGPDTRQYLAPRNIDFTAYAALKRYYIETGGMNFNGMRVPTDRAVSQVKILGAYTKAKTDPNYVVENFKLGPNNFVTLDSKTIVALGDALEEHIQECFNAEASVSKDIASGKAATLDQVDAAFAKLAA